MTDNTAIRFGAAMAAMEISEALSGRKGFSVKSARLALKLLLSFINAAHPSSAAPKVRESRKPVRRKSARITRKVS